MVMKQLLAFAAIVLTSLVVSAQGFDFEFYKLSLRWPTSQCIAAPQSCISPIPNFFTIHGLWPSFKNGTNVPPYHPATNPCNLNPSPVTDVVPAVTPIRGRLEARWQNIFTGFTDVGLWELQWLHHGMCSEFPQDPLVYFNGALDLAEDTKYDPLHVLGVPPSNTPYDIDILLENVKEKLGVYPEISCNMPVKGKQLYLKEIRFCFERAKTPTPFALRNCPVDMDNVCRSVQPLERTVMFPPAITTTRWPDVACRLLVYVQWVIIALLVLYILKLRYYHVRVHVE